MKPNNPRAVVGHPGGYVLEMKVCISFCKEVLSDILETAYECGIDYWAEQYYLETNQDGQRLALHFREEDEDEVQSVDQEGIAMAFRKIAEGKVEINTEIATHLLEAMMEQDAGMIDSSDADILVQIAAFGEIRYG